MNELVKTNQWRCLSSCNNCPFNDNGKSICLEDGVVDGIKVDLLKGNSFPCHKTVYDLDIDMNFTEPQDEKFCYGAYRFLKDLNKPNQIMQIAERLGFE